MVLTQSTHRNKLHQTTEVIEPPKHSPFTAEKTLLVLASELWVILSSLKLLHGASLPQTRTPRLSNK